MKKILPEVRAERGAGTYPGVCPGSPGGVA